MSTDKSRLTANDFAPEVLSPFDKYVHGGIDRRGFLDGAAKFAVCGVTAATLLEALSPKFAQAQQVLAADARIRAENVEFASAKSYGKGRAYVVRPAQAVGPLPAVLVVEGSQREVRGGEVPGHTQHGFNNDTTPRYDEAPAKQAWARTVGLFNRVLRG